MPDIEREKKPAPKNSSKEAVYVRNPKGRVVDVSPELAEVLLKDHRTGFTPAKQEDKTEVVTKGEIAEQAKKEKEVKAA
jgi:hypothetical protein